MTESFEKKFITPPEPSMVATACFEELAGEYDYNPVRMESPLGEIWLHVTRLDMQGGEVSLSEERAEALKHATLKRLQELNEDVHWEAEILLEREESGGFVFKFGEPQ